MKLVKKLFKAILAILAIVVILLLALPLWFGPVVKTVANVAVPKVVKTDFRLGHLSLNPYTARFELGGLDLSNPEGYSEKCAARVGSVAVDADVRSLASDVIHVEEITVKDVFVSYVDGGKDRVNNFKQIQYNVAGGKEKFEAAEAEKQQAAEQAAAQQPGQPAAEPAAEKPAKKVIIDKLTISGIKVQLGFIPLVVPVDIRLTDIGKDSGGATFAEVGQQIWASILKAAGALGDQFKALGTLTGESAGKTGKAVGEAAEKAGKALEALKGLW